MLTKKITITFKVLENELKIKHSTLIYKCQRLNHDELQEIMGRIKMSISIENAYITKLCLKLLNENVHMKLTLFNWDHFCASDVHKI